MTQTKFCVVFACDVPIPNLLRGHTATALNQLARVGGTQGLVFDSASDDEDWLHQFLGVVRDPVRQVGSLLPPYCPSSELTQHKCS